MCRSGVNGLDGVNSFNSRENMLITKMLTKGEYFELSMEGGNMQTGFTWRRYFMF